MGYGIRRRSMKAEAHRARHSPMMPSTNGSRSKESCRMTDRRSAKNRELQRLARIKTKEEIKKISFFACILKKSITFATN
jgi:hypothetical protein